MTIDRRDFIKLASGSLVYGFAVGCGDERPKDTILPTPPRVPKPKVLSHADIFFVDYTEWIFIHPDGTVTVHTGRIEMGQGLKTVISNVVSQGLRVAPDKLEIVMGDTGRCPDDGPTEGSGATRIIGWGHWAACARIRQDLLRRAGEKLGAPRDQLHHTEAGIRWPSEPDRLLTLADLVEDDGTVHLDLIDWRQVIRNNPPYTDRKTPAANARAIVTGGLQYVGDLFPGQCQYGAYLTPPYHSKVTALESIDLEAARKVPGVVSVGRTGRKAIPSAFVVGETYTAVQNGLEAMNARWRRPSRPKTIDHEAEIRAGAKLLKTMEEAGDPKTGFAESGLTLAETYVTQPASQVPLETESAVALLEEGRMKVWASTQAPFKILPWIARRTGKPKEEVRVISMPVGGGFGCKVDTLAPEEAAEMARDTGCRVKHIYSRDHQFNGIGRYKDVVVADIASGVSPEGKILSRTLDLYQDEGHGSTVTYDIPHVRTRLFGSDMPVRHATMRGTSFVQTCFAVESHTDMLAEKAGLDPVAFRKMNLHTASFGPLLDACAEMLGYDGSGLGRGRGIGFAICHHGGRQLGAVGAEVSVNLKTGRVKVERLAGAFDIGVVVNINTLTSNTRGAMMWGLGYALFEEVELDGHRSYTRSLDHYRIPRFSDVPPIQLAFLDNEVHREGMPRGCGELPVIPTVGAIANGVYRAIGVRFRTLPLTPKRVKRAMAG